MGSLLVFGAGPLSSHGASLINQFDAAGSGNSGTEDANPDDRWNDELSNSLFEWQGAVERTEVTSSRTNFTKQFEVPTNNQGDGGYANVSFGSGRQNLMVEAWVRADFSSLPAQEGVIWESGAGTGFSITANQETLKLYSSAAGGVAPSLDISPLDDSDFVQVSAIFDGNNDQAQLIARSAATGASVSSSASVTINSEVAGGGNPSGVFFAATAGQLGAAGAGGPLSNPEQFEGAMSLVNVYDGVDEALLEQSYQTAIPEPASMSLLAIGSVGLFASRRRRG
jgi:hypothetical protein